MNLFQYLAIGVVVAFVWWLTVRSVLRPGDEIRLPIVIMLWPMALAGLILIGSAMGLPLLFNGILNLAVGERKQ